MGRNPTLVSALKEGDPRTVAGLIASGANIRYRDDNGYDALIDAVHGRDVGRDGRLLALLTLQARWDPSARSKLTSKPTHLLRQSMGGGGRPGWWLSSWGT